MSRMLLATSVAFACFGLNGAIAQDVRSASVEAKVVYQEARRDCSLLTGSAHSQCLLDAKGNYLGNEMRCESKMGADKQVCLKQIEAADRRRTVSEANQMSAAPSVGATLSRDID